MRLIDADKLKQHYAWWGCGNADFRSEKQIFDDIVDLQPTVESRPKGKWLALDTPKGYVQEYKCSNCGVVTEDFAYCPMCGAMMFDEESVMHELEIRGEE